MERVTITINTTNDAFGDIPDLAQYELAQYEPAQYELARYELVRIINKLAIDIADGKEPETLLDINGNKVGKVVYE